MLEGFKPYYMAAGAPSITFTKNGVGISKAAVAKLNNPQYVRILFDGPGRRMAIQVCDEHEPAAIEFARDSKAEGIRWNTRDLSATIKKMTGWSVDRGEKYVVDGEFVDGEYPVLIFEFNNYKQG